MKNLHDDIKLTPVDDIEKSTESSPVNLKDSSLSESSTEKSASSSVDDFNQLENIDPIGDSDRNSNKVIDAKDLLISLDNISLADKETHLTDEKSVKEKDQGTTADYQKDSTQKNKSEIEEFLRKQLKENLRDRQFMLDIEKSLIEFINDEKLEFYKFKPMNRYYRMFVHRIVDYYGLGHNLDQTKQFIIAKKFKNNETSVPKEGFESIISKAEANKISKNSSNSLTDYETTKKHTNAQPSIKKHMILKREKNYHDQKGRKINESIRPKTYEEKSTDYIRIKNRIFSNETAPVSKADTNAIIKSSDTNVVTHANPKKYTKKNGHKNDIPGNKMPFVINNTINKYQTPSNESNKNVNQYSNNKFKRTESFQTRSFSFHDPIQQFNNYQKNMTNQPSYQNLQTSTAVALNFQQSFQTSQMQKSFTISNPSPHLQQHPQPFLAPNYHLPSYSMHEVSRQHNIQNYMKNNGPPLLNQHFPNNSVFLNTNNSIRHLYFEPFKQEFHHQNQNMQGDNNQFFPPASYMFQYQLPLSRPLLQSFNSNMFQQIHMPRPFFNQSTNRF